jgi:hypothetical protein
MCKLGAILEDLMRKILKSSPSIMLIDVLFVKLKMSDVEWVTAKLDVRVVHTPSLNMYVLYSLALVMTSTTIVYIH